jgi:hypothetical protein
MSRRDHALKVFTEIHDLISSHDTELRWSGVVYDRVRKCFRLLFKYKWGEVPPEKAYHAEEGVENWDLQDGVMEQYESFFQEVKEELRLACVSYHQLPTRPLDYGTYCAFMETYRMCMDDGDIGVIPTETEEKYLSIVVGGNMWTEVCAEADIKNVYLEHRLKYNAKLKDLVIKLAVHSRINQGRYKIYASVVEGFRNALMDVFEKVKSMYVPDAKTKSREEMDEDVEKYIKGQLMSYASYTSSQGIVSSTKTLTQDKRSDLLRQLHALCV